MADRNLDASDPMDEPAPGSAAPEWLLRYRVTVPEPEAHHVHRQGLIERCLPTNRPLTVLVAGGGFGKTTLLADCCRTLRERGVPTAWLSLEDDAPGMLENYLALAFEAAGLDVLGPLQGRDTDAEVVHHRTGLLVRAVEAHGGPCVLALDELERLKSPDAVAVLNYLVRWCPSGLHLALSARKLPAGLDLSGPMLGGRATVLTAEDLRFSEGEVGEFFDARLTRRELADVTAESAGWPMALRIHRNVKGQPLGGRAGLFRKMVEEWVESRLWFDFSAEDRELVLDAGLFEWLTPDVLDGVREQPGSMARLTDLPGLEGLVKPVDGTAANVWRLHPRLQEYCGDRLRREDPTRYETLHRGIAEALAHRDDVVGAMRHAAAAGDPRLVGRVLTAAGGVRLWLREGADRLVAAERFLTDETLAAYPGLALVRCVALSTAGRVAEARRQFEQANAATAAGQDADPDAGVDRVIVRGLMAHIGCEPVAAPPTGEIVDKVAAVVEGSESGPLIHGTMAYGMCYAHAMRGEFDAARRWGARARELTRHSSAYVRMGTDLQLGEVAMAQGDMHEAASWYRRGLVAARADFLREPRLTVYAEVMVGELELERSRTEGTAAGWQVSMDLYASCPKFAAYAAASELAVAGALATGGAEGALAVLDEMLDYATGAELPTVGRVVSALRVSTLAAAGRVAEAERAWSLARLPETDAGCVDLAGQSWREMEAVACARLRLLTARRALADGRRLTRKLLRVAAARGLRRTTMRGLALAMALERRWGSEAAAVEHAGAFVALFAETDYARSMVREREAGVAALRDFLEASPRSRHRAPAEALLGAMETTAPAAPALSVREAEVLRRLETESDAQIAAALGITRDGVRYYVKRLFGKLEVHSRFLAAQRARKLGLLPKDA